MANSNLLPIYKELFGEDFNYFEFDMRMKMQKAVYLLQDMGVPMGRYSYRWYLHGPYSHKLQDDMYEERNNETGALVISQENLERIQKLAAVFNYWEAEERKGEAGYEQVDWVECLGSLHYIRKRFLSADASNEEILAKLKEKKPHLANKSANAIALVKEKELFTREN